MSCYAMVKTTKGDRYWTWKGDKSLFFGPKDQVKIFDGADAAIKEITELGIPLETIVLFHLTLSKCHDLKLKDNVVNILPPWNFGYE